LGGAGCWCGGGFVEIQRGKGKKGGGVEESLPKKKRDYVAVIKIRMEKKIRVAIRK